MHSPLSSLFAAAPLLFAITIAPCAESVPGTQNPIYQAAVAYAAAHPDRVAYPPKEPVPALSTTSVAAFGTTVLSFFCNGTLTVDPDAEFLVTIQPQLHSCAEWGYDTAPMLTNAWVPGFIFSSIGCLELPVFLAEYVADQLNSGAPGDFLATHGPADHQVTISYPHTHTIAVSSGQDISGVLPYPGLTLDPACAVNNLIDGTRGNERAAHVSGLRLTAQLPATPTPTNTPTRTPTPTSTPTSTSTPTRTPTATPVWLILCTCHMDPQPLDKDADRLLDLFERAHLESHLGRPHVCLPDTDGDGLADGDEDANSNGILDPGESDPLRPDTDGDGFDDGVEVQIVGSHPADPGSPGLDPDDADGDRLPEVIDPCPGFHDCDEDGIDDGFEAVHCGVPAMLDPTRKPPLGDVDCFAGISNLDALIVQSVFLRLFGCDTAAGTAWSDVNLDGEITNLDALIMQYAFLGLVQRLPIR